jgi:hypothetical protein
MIRIDYIHPSAMTGGDIYQTEITAYLWAGFLGEWDSEKETFCAWEIISPYQWKQRPDIVSPPKSCIGITTTPVRVQVLGARKVLQFEQCCRVQEQE